MTSAVSNTLNNLNEMLLANSKFEKASDTVNSNMSKLKDFESVFDKTIDKKNLNNFEKINSTTNNLKTKDKNLDSGSLQTLKNIKNLDELKATINEFKEINSGDDSVDWADFKAILEKITAEANVETSLDLTLARDINEIIAQLKEAVENATISIDDLDESLNVDSIVALEDLESDESAEEVTQDIVAPQKTEKKALFEQLLALMDKTLKIEGEEIAQEVEVTTSAKLAETVSETVEKIEADLVEFTENVSEEVSLGNTSTDDSQSFELNIDEEILKELKIESISAETGSSNEDSLMQNQTPEEYAIKAMINQEVEVFDVKIDSLQSVNNSQSIQTQPKSMDISPSRIIDQIVKHMENLQNNSKVTMVLNPESLGKVNIQLLTTKEGLTAQFTVATQEARDLIMKGLDGLKESLMSHGVGVDNFSVKVADTSKSEYRQDWTEQEGSRGGNKGDGQPNREEKEKGLFEKMMAQSQDDENGNV